MRPGSNQQGLGDYELHVRDLDPDHWHDHNHDPAYLISCIKSVEEENAKLKLSQSKQGNPAVVGLAGFGLTTLVLQFKNVGWISVSPVIWLGLVFGGGAQLIAGLMEFGTGNNFGFCAFTTYGCFWISFALMEIGNNAGILAGKEMEVGAFLVAFTLISMIFWVASLQMNWGMFFIFTTLVIGLILLDIAMLAEVPVLVKVAGYILIPCALSAWYCMAHILYKDAYKRDILPVGNPPLFDLRRCRHHSPHIVNHIVHA